MKTALPHIFSVLILSLSGISSCNAFKFNNRGEFTILQFTDFHYGEDDIKDAKTQALQRKILDLVKPDLAVVSGDAVGGYAGYIFYLFTNHGFFKKCWEKFTTPFVETKTPYAFTLGNHDAEADLDASQIVKLDKTNPFSVLRTAEGIEGTANYRIPIYSSKNQSHLAANIWMFDTGNIGCFGQDDSWGCIEEEQIAWYNSQSESIKKEYGNNVHHIAFYHIPIPEYIKVSDEQKIYGISKDGVGCPTHNTGFFDHIVKNGDISGMFVGHDHNNDLGGWYKNVEFVYGRKSGYGSYGSIFGARVIKLKEVTINGKTFLKRTHYVIQEDLSIVTTKFINYRKGAKQFQCFPVNEHPFLLLRATGFFDYIGILLALMIIVGSIILLSKVVFCKSVHREEKPETLASAQNQEMIKCY